MNEKFIYAVIEKSGVSPPLAGSTVRGIDGAALETVCFRDLIAVISSVDIERFSESKDTSGQKEERLKEDMLRYQQVNLFLLENSLSCGMLPLRFGFTAKDYKDVKEVLGRTYIQLKTLLERLKGKVELVVQAFWDLPKVLQEIRNEESRRNWGGQVEINFQDRPFQSDVSDCVEVGRILFEAAEVRRKKFIEAIHNNLSPLAKDFSEGPRKAEAMILNRSYLVEKEKEPLFDEAVNFLGTTYEELLTFRYIGPLPTYSFVNIELNQGNFAILDRARKTLRLPEKASLGEIKASYRKLILTHHPDRNPGSPRAEEQCKDVVNAYEILKTYCQSVQPEDARSTFSQGVDHVPTPGYSFSKEEVEKVFVASKRIPSY
jgi:hypothetical protein